VEVLSMLMSGGQGREEGNRQGGELHCGFRDRLEGYDIDNSETLSLFNLPKQSMLSQSS
jgi:hypothetical protein